MQWLNWPYSQRPRASTHEQKIIPCTGSWASEGSNKALLASTKTIQWCPVGWLRWYSSCNKRYLCSVISIFSWQSNTCELDDGLETKIWHRCQIECESDWQPMHLFVRPSIFVSKYGMRKLMTNKLTLCGSETEQDSDLQRVPSECSSGQSEPVHRIESIHPLWQVNTHSIATANFKLIKHSYLVHDSTESLSLPDTDAPKSHCTQRGLQTHTHFLTQNCLLT